MTKIRKSRRGFTLLEIVIVVAIIVIVAGAAFLGVTVTLKRANNARNQLIKNKGDNFEVNARNEIEHLKADPNFTPIQEYTPEGENDEVNNQPGNKNSPTPTPTNTPTPTPKPTNTNTNTPTPTPKSTNTPTPTPKPTNTPTPVPTEVQDTDNPTPSYGNTGRPTTGTTTYASNDTSAATGTSVNIKQKGDQYNNCILNVSVPSDVVSFVVYIPGATNEKFSGYNSNQVTSLGNGYYRITNPNKVTSQEFYSSSFKGSTGAYVVEYTK